MRGDNASSISLNCNGVRFTPTCVGTIANTKPKADEIPVHPHVCGDN